MLLMLLICNNENYKMGEMVVYVILVASSECLSGRFKILRGILLEVGF